MKKQKLEEKTLHRLFEFAQDFVNASGDSGRELADKSAYQFVDAVHFEDIHLREVYTQFYENEKKRGLNREANRSIDHGTGKLIS